jgi:multidrug resistance efflux pump
MFKSLLKKPLIRVGLVVAVAALALFYFFGRKSSQSNGTYFVARRGNLPINVLEGGSVEAIESQEIRSEVKGYQGTKILSIVEEGYLVTEDDVKEGKVLVELDSSDLKDRLTTQEIQYQSTLSAYVQAKQAYDIQLNQNQSDVKAAEQTARFARMDFEKYLGAIVAKEVLDKMGLRETPFTNDLDFAELEQAFNAASNSVAQTQSSPNFSREVQLNGIGSAGAPTREAQPGSRRESGNGIADASSPRRGNRPDGAPRARNEAGGSPSRAGESATPPGSAVRPGPAGNNDRPTIPLQLANSGPAIRPVLAKTNIVVDDSLSKGIQAVMQSAKIKIDFTEYADTNKLGDGSAKQLLRKLDDDLNVAKQDAGLAQTKFEGTQRLKEKNFVTKTDYDNDKINFEKAVLRVATAKTAKDLFITYEFPKTAEEYLSKAEEGLRQLERARKAAISKLAQSRALLKSSEGRYRIETFQRQEMIDQYQKCVIRAQRPGLVVYGGGSDRHFGNEDQIREGASVRERQVILTIPDMTQMAVRVKIHESHIKKVTKGLPSRIHIDAFPDETLEGEILKVAVLPDSQNRWMNPDMKVYQTTVAVHGSHDWVKPGMSARVEILVKELTNVVYVPIQAVVPVKGKTVCFVAAGVGSSEMRPVEVGEYNDEFIEIRGGLKDGDKVLLRAPEGVEKDQGNIEGENENGAAPAAPAPVQPPSSKAGSGGGGGGGKAGNVSRDGGGAKRSRGN